MLEPHAREEREGDGAASGPRTPAGVQGRERRGRRAGGLGRRRASGPGGDGAESLAGEGSRCPERSSWPRGAERGCGRRADAAGARLAGRRLRIRC